MKTRDLELCVVVILQPLAKVWETSAPARTSLTNQTAHHLRGVLQDNTAFMLYFGILNNVQVLSR